MRVKWAALFVLGLAAAGALLWAQSAEQRSASKLVRYDEEGNLLLPQGWDRWVLVGSSLGLGYSEGQSDPEREAFHNVLMEPSAYDHYLKTGEFPEKTMLALAIYSQARRESIARRGAYTKDFMALEIALKDHERFEKGWAYFGFGQERPRAKAVSSNSCYSCHNEHGQLDNVFVQFYPKLRTRAGRGVSTASGQQQPSDPAEKPEPQLALKGNDPVLLTRGETTLGKEEFQAVQGHFIYRFSGAESLAAFRSDPERYGIQNEMCPVAPDFPASPDLYYVHEGRIYIFATANCIDDFKADPQRYLTPKK